MRHHQIKDFFETGPDLRDQLIGVSAETRDWYQARIGELRAFVPALVGLIDPLIDMPAMPGSAAGTGPGSEARKEIEAFNAAMTDLLGRMTAVCRAPVEKFEERIAAHRAFEVRVREATDTMLGLPRVDEPTADEIAATARVAAMLAFNGHGDADDAIATREPDQAGARAA